MLQLYIYTSNLAIWTFDGANFKAFLCIFTLLQFHMPLLCVNLNPRAKMIGTSQTALCMCFSTLYHSIYNVKITYHCTFLVTCGLEKFYIPFSKQ